MPLDINYNYQIINFRHNSLLLQSGVIFIFNVSSRTHSIFDRCICINFIIVVFKFRSSLICVMIARKRKDKPNIYATLQRKEKRKVEGMNEKKTFRNLLLIHLIVYFPLPQYPNGKFKPKFHFKFIWIMGKYMFCIPLSATVAMNIQNYHCCWFCCYCCLATFVHYYQSQSDWPCIKQQLKIGA